MEQRDLYIAISRNLPLGLSVVNKEGKIIEFNKVARKITGYARKEVLGLKHLDLFHGSSGTANCPLIHGSLKDGKHIVRWKRNLGEKTERQ